MMVMLMIVMVMATSTLFSMFMMVVMMPLFFLLFLGLAVYIATLPGASEGYRYLFVLDPAGLLDPYVWVYALGQAFFSLSIAGNGTLIYGS